MKLFYQYLLFLCLSIASFAQEAYIASFNVLKLGESPKDFETMAKTIEHFDLVGLEEVITPEGLERLVKSLNKYTNHTWDYHISPFPVGTRKYKEYYAYVWKKDSVTFLSSEGFYPDREKLFIREPYGANFQIGKFDFTFVLQHAVYGKSETERRAEAFQLVKVYRYFQDRNKKENDILIGGDFNLSAFDEAFSSLYEDKDQIIYGVDPRIKTTIGMKKMANSYDNIFLSKKYTEEFTGKSGAIDFTNRQYKVMRNKVSDHLPVFIIVNIDRDDD